MANLSCEALTYEVVADVQNEFAKLNIQFYQAEPEQYDPEHWEMSMPKKRFICPGCNGAFHFKSSLEIHQNQCAEISNLCALLRRLECHSAKEHLNIINKILADGNQNRNS